MKAELLMIESKEKLMLKLKSLGEDIDALSDESSLATLDHKLVVRQGVLESLFCQHKSSLNNYDLDFIKNIMVKNKTLLNTMEKNKSLKSNAIIKSKNSGKRVKIYTSIAKQS